MDGMNRRDFLVTARDAAALGAIAAALQPLSAIAAPAAANGTAASPVYFDPRFPAARAAAQRLAGSATVVAIAGDATELMLAAGSAQQALTLRGVTTESVPFCLAQLMVGGKRPTLTQTRLDQDLFSWTLEYRA